MAKGMEHAFNVASMSDEKHQIIILFTDGQADDKKESVKIAERINGLRKTRNKELMFFCFGVGDSIDSIHLRQIGEAANDGKAIIKDLDPRLLE